jgi:hypothetical protein
MSQTAKILTVAAVLLALAIIVPLSSSFVVLLATRALVFAILAMSVDLLLGFVGGASLGHAAALSASLRSARRRISASALIWPRSSPPNTISAWAGIFGWWCCWAC